MTVTVRRSAGDDEHRRLATSAERSSFLIASAIAGLAGVALALGLAEVVQAAEKPPWMTRQAVEGLKACPDGGFALPGSATCIRLGGTVTSTTILRSGKASTALAASPRQRLFSQSMVGRVTADVRVETELGLLRAYTSLRVPVGEDAGLRR